MSQPSNSTSDLADELAESTSRRCAPEATPRSRHLRWLHCESADLPVTQSWRSTIPALVMPQLFPDQTLDFQFQSNSDSARELLRHHGWSVVSITVSGNPPPELSELLQATRLQAIDTLRLAFSNDPHPRCIAPWMEFGAQVVLTDRLAFWRFLPTLLQQVKWFDDSRRSLLGTVFSELPWSR